MIDYTKSKIYAIRSPNTEKVYIGYTVQPLCKRFSTLVRVPNKTSCKIIIDAGDAYIELIEEYSCENIEQLNKRYGEIIRTTSNCINKK